MSSKIRIGVVVPVFRCSEQIVDVLSRMGKEVHSIYVVDDACPENSGKLVSASCSDSRIKVIYHLKNRGVGGAVKTGYRSAVADGCDGIVKVDGDGQLPPEMIPSLVEPIENGRADYSKGNRFHYPGALKGMPLTRVIGNSILSLVAKFSTGYYDIFDPTNGFTAVSRHALEKMKIDSAAERFYFETSMLFELNAVDAVVEDVPMESCYGEESSNLTISRSIFTFGWYNFVYSLRRVWYRYFVRGFGPASVFLLVGIFLMTVGLALGTYFWVQSSLMNEPTTSGSVMLAALPMIMGYQSLMSFIQYDIGAVPRKAISKFLA